MAVIRAVMEEFPDLKEDEALVLMGHGTTHYANAIYAALDYTFKDMGYSRVFLGTVEAYPSMESLKKQIRALGPKRLILAPFMVVAGDHAIHDMSGQDEDSWRSQFRAGGLRGRLSDEGTGRVSGRAADLSGACAGRLKRRTCLPMPACKKRPRTAVSAQKEFLPRSK